MKKTTVLYARYLAPGSFVANEWTAPVDSLDPRDVPWPDRAYAFTLHRREDVIDGDQTFTGKAEQIGPTYYHPDSKVESLDEVRGNPNATSILVSNMKMNGWTHIVWSRWGNWPQTFDPAKDEVIAR